MTTRNVHTDDVELAAIRWANYLLRPAATRAARGVEAWGRGNGAFACLLEDDPKAEFGLKPKLKKAKGSRFRSNEYVIIFDSDRAET